MKRAYRNLFISLFLFGSNGIVANQIHTDSIEIVFFRCMLGSLLLTVIFRTQGNRVKIDFRNKNVRLLIFSGIAMGVSWVFLFQAYTQIGVGVSTLLYYCAPVFVIALSPLLFSEKISTVKAISFAVVLCGIILLNGHFVLAGRCWAGVFTALASAIAYAGMIILNKKAKDVSSVERAIIQLLSACSIVTVFMVARQGVYFQLSWTDVPWICILGFLNTGIGCWLFFSSIAQLSAQTISICGYMEPLSAVVFSALLLHEKLSSLQVLGAFLIISGALCSELLNKVREPAAQKDG